LIIPAKRREGWKKMYKGYETNEEVISGSVIEVIEAPCGCMACEDQVQPGHFACSTSPVELRSDPNVQAVLVDSRWIWIRL
jgi:hypothetical protein